MKKVSTKHRSRQTFLSALLLMMFSTVEYFSTNLVENDDSSDDSVSKNENKMSCYIPFLHIGMNFYWIKRPFNKIITRKGGGVRKVPKSVIYYLNRPLHIGWEKNVQQNSDTGRINTTLQVYTWKQNEVIPVGFLPIHNSCDNWGNWIFFRMMFSCDDSGNCRLEIGGNKRHKIDSGEHVFCCSAV